MPPPPTIRPDPPPVGRARFFRPVRTPPCIERQLRAIELWPIALGTSALLSSLAGLFVGPPGLFVIPAAVIVLFFSVREAVRRSAVRWCRAAIGRDGHLCLQCGYSLDQRTQHGQCPECGHAYTVAEVLDVWVAAEQWLRHKQWHT